MSIPRVIFLGMPGSRFSLPPLAELVDNRAAQVAAIVAPGFGPSIHFWENPVPIAGRSESLPAIAARANIPLAYVGELKHPDSLSFLRSVNPDFLVVACFDRILPPEWLEIPRRGCLNLHPSLLPAYRGPAPLFWQFRAGEQHMGVTLHCMDAGMDSGDILYQQQISFPVGTLTAEVEEGMARQGAKLLVKAMQARSLPVIPQNQTGRPASRQGFPTQADLRLDTNWTARRAFDFMRGAQNWGPFVVGCGAGKIGRAWALDWSPGRSQPAEIQPAGAERFWVQFLGGCLLISGRMAFE